MNYKIPQPKKSVVRNDDDSSLNTEFFECGGMFFFFFADKLRGDKTENKDSSKL